MSGKLLWHSDFLPLNLPPDARKSQNSLLSSLLAGNSRAGARWTDRLMRISTAIGAVNCADA